MEHLEKLSEKLGVDISNDWRHEDIADVKMYVRQTTEGNELFIITENAYGKGQIDFETEVSLTKPNFDTIIDIIKDYYDGLVYVDCVEEFLPEEEVNEYIKTL